MDVAVMGPARRDRELIADLEPHRAGLSESQMVGVTWASRANQTRLRAHEFEVGLVAEPPRFAEPDILYDSVHARQQPRGTRHVVFIVWKGSS